jgi:uncharacterized protein involved in exopolysaccharide biosynthesis
MDAADKDLHADAMGLRALLQALLSRKVFVIVVALVCGALALTWRLLTPRVYNANVLVAVVDQQDGLAGGLSALVGQLGPLASLAGGLGQRNNAQALALLQSRVLLREFISTNNLLPLLFAKKWDAEKKDWKPGLSHVPTLWDGVESFIKLRRVAQDSKTGLITLSVAWTDAKTASQWANDLVRLTNEMLRRKELVESRKNIDYLTAQAKDVSQIEVQNAVSALIQREMKREMLANGTQDFALTIIDPSVPAEKPAAPGVRLSIVIGVFLGFLFSVFYLFMRMTLGIRSVDRVS